VRNMQALTTKYDIPAPRYTSYPSVPCWDQEAPSQEQWKQLVGDSFRLTHEKEGISIYIHLPFCESLCTYCGCNTRITVNHQVEQPYINAVLTEWRMYLELFEEMPRIREIHLGGGTPTFFSADHLAFLVQGIISGSILCPDAELSFEGHPDNTSIEHLEKLNSLGFKRISFGIQDFDMHVQRAIHRFQSYETVERITSLARMTGYDSINYDLVYGLPLQTVEGITDTLEKVVRLQPDRIAFYSYAHVPWIKPGQRAFTEKDLPDTEAKRTLYEIGKTRLLEAGYQQIGMDHFALSEDPLYEAATQKKLHRNFMGYTVSQTDLLIGLGVSSISDTWNGFVQNEKKVEDYYRRLAAGNFPIFKGHCLTQEDLLIRRHILSVMCAHETSWEGEQLPEMVATLERLQLLQADGLIELSVTGLTVTPQGQPFLRNICMAFDARLHATKEGLLQFSKTT
jgi:oxygen-independent coproporphyrinogen-3 oxidase